MNITSLITKFAQASPDCEGGGLFGLPSWHKYIKKNDDCSINIDFSTNPNDIWLIVLGVVDALLWIGGIIAVGMIMYGGVQYISSQGEPDRTAAAKNTIINAFVGLGIVVIAVPLVAFIAGEIS